MLYITMVSNKQHYLIYFILQTIWCSATLHSYNELFSVCAGLFYTRRVLFSCNRLLGHVTTFWIFMRIKTALMIKHRKQSMINYQLITSYRRSVCVKINRHNKKKHFLILTGNPICEAHPYYQQLCYSMPCT